MEATASESAAIGESTFVQDMQNTIEERPLISQDTLGKYAAKDQRTRTQYRKTGTMNDELLQQSLISSINRSRSTKKRRVQF